MELRLTAGFVNEIQAWLADEASSLPRSFIGQALGLRIVAEGVETLEARSFPGLNEMLSCCKVICSGTTTAKEFCQLIG